MLSHRGCKRTLEGAQSETQKHGQIGSDGKETELNLRSGDNYVAQLLKRFHNKTQVDEELEVMRSTRETKEEAKKRRGTMKS